LRTLAIPEHLRSAFTEALYKSTFTFTFTNTNILNAKLENYNDLLFILNIKYTAVFYV